VPSSICKSVVQGQKPFVQQNTYSRGKGTTLTPSCTADLDLFVCFSSPESQRRKERKHPKPAATMNLGNLIAGLLIAIIAIIAICAGLGWYSRR
jgi:hypothetical protein